MYKANLYFLYFIAFGVAHQALEEIEPSKETVLIIGNYVRHFMLKHYLYDTMQDVDQWDC